MTENQKKIRVSYEMPVPSKGPAERYFTERLTYRVQNVLVPRPVEIEGVAPHVLRSSINLRIFREDLIDTEEGLQRFFEMAPGVEPTTRGLISGVYKSHGRDLRIMVKGLAKDDFRNRMPVYVVDPARKDGRTNFTQHLNMSELISALAGDDRFDRIMRHGRAPIQGMRVGKKVSGTGVDSINAETRVSYTGYMLVYLPSQPTVDLEEGTAAFSGLNELGCAIYIPTSFIGFAINLFYKLEPRWREMIGKEHELVEAESQGERRLQLTSGHVAQKPRKPEGEPKPKRDRKARKGKDKAEAAKPEGEATEAKPEGEDADHESATTAEA